MKKLVATVSALAVGSALGAGIRGANAQEAFDLGEIAVFANRAGQETELKRTGATIEVVTEEDLRQAPETTVADYLSRLPGLSVSANGALGASTQLRIRGLDGKYIKVLVDGIDVTDPSQPQTQFNWAGLTTTAVSRIEILKGTSSSLYGSRAIGGVINITTAPRQDTPGTLTTMTAEGGSYDTLRLGASVAHRGERGGLSVSLNHVNTRGFSAKAGAANTEPDGYRGTQLNLSGDIQASDALKLGFSAYALNGNGDYDEWIGDGAPPYDETFSTRTRAARGFAAMQTGGVQNTLSYSYYQNDRVFNSNGFSSPFFGKRQKLDYTGVYRQSDALQYTFGADWQRESFDTGADSGSEDNSGLFAEALYAPREDVDLAASLRYDNYQSFGGNLSGRLAAAWQLSNATTLNAVAATGFRAPSLYELNSTLYGNPSLRPEESTSFELGVTRQFGPGSYLRGTAFYNRIDNLIQFVVLSFVPVFTGQYRQVAGTSTTKGVELAGAWAVSDRVRLFGNYTYTETSDATGARLLRVPGHDLVVGLNADLSDRWRANLSLQHVADRPDEFGTAMPNYTVVNAGLSYQLTDGAAAYLRIENLTDETYQTSAGYNASGRAIFAGLRAAF